MWKEKLGSRKLWMAVAGALILILNDGLGLGIPEDTFWGVVTLILGYIFAQAAIDIKKNQKN